MFCLITYLCFDVDAELLCVSVQYVQCNVSSTIFLVQ